MPKSKHNRAANERRSSTPSPPSPLSPFVFSQKTRKNDTVASGKTKKRTVKKNKNLKTKKLHAHVRSGSIRKVAMSVARRTRVRKDKSIAAVSSAMRVVDSNPKDARGLSTRDQLFVRNMLKGMTQQDAMQLASEAIGVKLTAGSANTLAGEAVQREEVASAIVQAFEEAGIDDKLVAEKMREGLDATAYTQTGIEHTDYRTRLGYLQTILKVKKQLNSDVDVKAGAIAYQSFMQPAEGE